MGGGLIGSRRGVVELVREMGMGACEGGRAGWGVLGEGSVSHRLGLW